MPKASLPALFIAFGLACTDTKSDSNAPTSTGGSTYIGQVGGMVGSGGNGVGGGTSLGLGGEASLGGTLGSGGGNASGGFDSGGTSLGGVASGGVAGGSGGAASGGAAEGGSASGGMSTGGGNSGGTGVGGMTLGSGGLVGEGGEGTGGTGTDTGGQSATTGGQGEGGEPPIVLDLPPPSACSNQFNVQDCKVGDTSSPCDGLCANDNGPTSKNACESGKEGVPVQFACVRHMLFSTEMTEAVAADGFAGSFHYGIVGHDPDFSNLDQGLPNSCCQCYQLVFDVPTYLTASVLTPPLPLIVQSANTAASGALGFDVFMGAGGLGAFNACNADLGLASSFGYSMYTGYPRVGQAFSGGVKPGPDSVDCADEHNNLTDALIDAPACQEKIEAACNEITASTEAVQADTRRSCIQSNQGSSYYHENWNVYARRVVCPPHLMEVTGCKLPVEPGLPLPDPTVLTAADAANAGFSAGYHTTTMQDCCMPTCAWSNNVQVETVDGYNSFYSCLEDGTPVTE